MFYRLFVVCFALACITTFISLQQTQQNRIHYKNVLSQAYSRYDDNPEQSDPKVLKYKLLDPNRFGIIASKEELLKQYYIELFKSSSFLQSRLKKKNVRFPTDSFLLPVMYYNMGPNNLFRIFKETLVIGYFIKRSLVVPQFHHHPRMKRRKEIVKKGRKKSSEEVDIDIFDQTYKSIFENNPRRTIDLKLINNLLPTITMNQFQAKCNQNLDSLIVCGVLGQKRKTGLEHFKKVTNISISRVYSIEIVHDLLHQETFEKTLIKSNHRSSKRRCLGLALGSNCLGSRSAWFDLWKNFSSFVRRPPEAVILAKRFIAAVFHNKPFLAVHWRYETKDWQDMCKLSRPDTVRRVNEPTCEMARQIEGNKTFLDQLSIHLKTYAEKHQLCCIYFAAPPQLTAIMEQLKSRTEGLYFIADVAKFARNNFVMEDVFENNFMSSFVEQELCYLSERFLGSPLSSWTQTVMLDRFSEDRNNHESILDLFKNDTQDVKNFPNLRWYFPEGD